LHPEDFGVPRARPEDLAGGDRAQNAVLVQAILQGTPGPQSDIVLVNASAALVTAGLAPDYRAGLALARQAIDSGRARDTLDALVRFTTSAD
jgi:anthranilate phosphoribosyltransferase